MITRDGDKGKTLTRRAAMLAGGELFLSTVLLGRMYYLQVLEADRYKTLAEENSVQTLIEVQRLNKRIKRPAGRFRRLIGMQSSILKSSVVNYLFPMTRDELWC